MHILDELDKASLRDNIPDFRAGDTVKVHVNIVADTVVGTLLFAHSRRSRFAANYGHDALAGHGSQ